MAVPDSMAIKVNQSLPSPQKGKKLKSFFEVPNPDAVGPLTLPENTREVGRLEIPSAATPSRLVFTKKEKNDVLFFFRQIKPNNFVEGFRIPVVTFLYFNN